MELLVAAAISVLVAAGIYLMLRARTFPVVAGLTLLSYAVNVMLFAMGRLKVGRPPILSEDTFSYTDPLPQALVLTAIVISFSFFAFLLVLAFRAYQELGTDEVNEMRQDHDPIITLKEKILDDGDIDEDGLKQIDAEIRKIVNEAAEFAQNAPEPDPSELYTDIHLEETA